MIIFLLFFFSFSFAQESSIFLEDSLEEQFPTSNDFYQFRDRHKGDFNPGSLISNGISLSVKNDSGLSVDAPDKSGYTLLHWSIISKDIFLFTNTLKYGANVNLTNKEGLTPLHMAVESESLDMIKTLINHGAIVNARDNQGMTALHKAALLPQGMLLADYLITYGAAPFIQDHNGHTALDLAKLHSNKLMMSFLSGVERNFFRPEEY